tara:strand:+ start:470 stop:856 length:387 start_codon:yes stop_codon:yes gene_type:complete
VNKGFTLIELLIVVALLGIISVIGILNFGDNISSSKKEDAKISLQKIQMMQEQYTLENSLTNYWSTGSTCDNKTTEIESILFSGENALNDNDYFFCIIPFETNGFKAKAISKKDSSELWIDYKNNNNW